MSVSVEVWGDYACFSRPEMKTERVSYDVITPSAARGLLEAVYYHPGMRWIVDRIRVCAPIRFTNIRRNEVKDTISARKVKAAIKLFERVKACRKEGVVVPRSYADYAVSVDEANLPDGVTCIRMG